MTAYYLISLLAVLLGGLATAAIFINLAYRILQYGKPRPNIKKSH